MVTFNNLMYQRLGRGAPTRRPPITFDNSGRMYPGGSPTFDERTGGTIPSNENPLGPGGGIETGGMWSGPAPMAPGGLDALLSSLGLSRPGGDNTLRGAPTTDMMRPGASTGAPTDLRTMLARMSGGDMMRPGGSGLDLTRVGARPGAGDLGLGTLGPGTSSGGGTPGQTGGEMTPGGSPNGFDPNGGMDAFKSWLNNRKGWNPDGTHSIGSITYDENGRPTNYDSIGRPLNGAPAIDPHQFSLAQNQEADQAGLSNGHFVNGVFVPGAGAPAGGGNQPPIVSDPGLGGGGPGPGGPMPPTGAQPLGGVNPTGTAVTNSGPNFPTFGSQDQYQFTPSGTYVDPSYQFRLDEGNRALMANKAATGSLGSGQTLRDLVNYNQNAASTEYGKAYDRFNTDRGFNYGVSRDDRDFGYNAARDDRNFAYNAATGDLDRNYRNAMGIAGLGLQGAGGGANINSILASLLSGNLNTLGQIQGTGTMGGSNALTGGLGQILQMLLSNQTMNRFFPQQAGMS